MNSAPLHRHEVIGPETAELVLDDGVTLVSDIYRPAGEGRFPVLLMRQPYGRAIASTIVLAHPAWYAAHGYIVVVQDVRGCGDSEGRFDAFINEASDGAQTLDWAADLPRGNGKLGLYGFSYQAVTQYLAFSGGGRRPDAIAPSMGAWMPRDDWAFEGNGFRLTGNLGWARQMALLSAAREGRADICSALQSASQPMALRNVLLDHPEFSHFGRWYADDPDYWSKISPGTLLRDDPLGIPALHVGGWNDFLLRGTLSADAAFRAKSPDTTHLIVGPWSHMPWNRAAGAADMGPDAEFSVDRAQLEFFDFYLKGEGERPVAQQLFDMGTRRWGKNPLEPAAQEYFIASSGLASTLLSDGWIELAPGPAGVDRVVHDPTNPAPLIGGHLGSPLGFVDRGGTDNRADVAVYTSAPLAMILPLAGPVSADLWIETGAGFDLCASLTLVDPSGAARVLCTGFLRSTQPGRGMVEVDLGAVCVTVPQGYRLRLSVQGAGAGAFENYPGTPADVRQPPPNQTPITLCIRHGDATPSRLILPARAKDTHDVN